MFVFKNFQGLDYFLGSQGPIGTLCLPLLPAEKMRKCCRGAEPLLADRGCGRNTPHGDKVQLNICQRWQANIRVGRTDLRRWNKKTKHNEANGMWLGLTDVLCRYRLMTLSGMLKGEWIHYTQLKKKKNSILLRSLPGLAISAIITASDWYSLHENYQQLPPLSKHDWWLFRLKWVQSLYIKSLNINYFRAIIIHTYISFNLPALYQN